jgi:two-component system NtrC family sensor kinase
MSLSRDSTSDDTSDLTAHRALAERYRRVVETTNDAIVITDLDRRISFANPAAVALFGYGSALVGMPVARTSPEELRDHVRAREDAALGGDPQRYESVIVRADGERRIVAIANASLRELGAVSGILASLRDITEERRARDAVILSEARYRNLFDSASDSIYTLDGRGCFSSVNDATLQMTGRTSSQLLGHNSRSLVVDEELTHVREQFERAFAGTAIRFECHFRRADGERRLVSVNNTPLRRGQEIVGVLGIARDVTDERANAAALARAEARYTRLVESASDAIFTMDERGCFTSLNACLEEALGRKRDQLIGTPFADLIDRRDLALATRLLHDTFAGERHRGSLRYCDAFGEVRFGSVITSPILEEGVIVGALGIMRDVTEERRLGEQMLQQEKLAAVGQLVSGVAHELNNPLAAVMAFAELLRAMPSVDPDALTAVNTIHQEAQRAAKIVRHLLTFARQQPAERVVADLNAIVSDTLALRQYAFRDLGIELDSRLEPDLPLTWADPSQLQQVVLNLVGNAEQAVAERAAPRRIIVRTTHGHETLTLSISDTGAGITPDRLNRIFNPFYTTKPVGQGTGLGLSISDGIVREHGGRIFVESTPGDGATFIVELPVVAPPATTPGEAQRTAEPPAGTGRLLVADHEPAMRAAISSFLVSLGHVVDAAATAGEARALLGANEYDVVLLDVRMPGEGGESLYQELHERDLLHANRVVFVTGGLQSEEARRLLAAANRPNISKPFQLDDLASVVAGVMR